jgi:hypothetical protein
MTGRPVREPRTARPGNGVGLGGGTNISLTRNALLIKAVMLTYRHASKIEARSADSPGDAAVR